MTDQADGVEEALEATLRIALTVAGRIAERHAREREQQLRSAQAASEQEARELRNRLDAERGSARAALAPVARDEWWERAYPGAIAEAWETANTWKDTDPDAQRAHDRIAAQLSDRYGIDVRELGADPAAVRDALERREQDRQQGGAERAAARQEEAEAAHLLAGSDDVEPDQQPQEEAVSGDLAETLYDSADRRRDLASSLETIADRETIDARVLADVNQARPAAEAVAADAGGRTPKARPNRGAGRGQARRSERGR
ncbi:MAG: hypothetical protein M3376_05855 [Actinomycetota bacterium]|nr:hypothetical protein [Actinomycetota bacterium]